MSSTGFLKQLRSTNYRLLGLVGSGQFGQVYCAIHRKTGRLVALKNLNRDRFPTHQFLRELRFLLSLNHPHIANCLALEQSANGRQLVLDYCEGGTLRDILEQETPLTLAEILTLVVEVLEALEHAQNAHIVHCDIKPENILLTLTANGWQAKVSDFGIARLSQEFQGDRSGATGSPAYMAPERFYHQFAISSDLYAVGVVLYEMLLGDRPFSGSYNQLMVAHLNQAVKIPETLPPAVRSLLSKSLEKLMARRFQSAAAMKAAIIAARQTLTATELRNRFPKSLSPSPLGHFAAAEPITYTLAHQCEGLRVVTSGQTEQLMAFSEQHVWGWSLSDAAAINPAQPDAVWQLPAPIVSLSNTTNGAIATTSQDWYRLQPGQPPQRLATFAEPMQPVVGGQRWLIAQTQARPHQFWLIDTSSRAPQSPQQLALKPAADELVSLFLDNRHLLLAEPKEQSTDLSIASRHGKPIGKLRISAPLHQLTSSQQSLQVLAQAGTQGRDLLVIQLKPYRIMRCRLDITADWIGELVTGFAVISQTGQLRLVNYQGQMIGQVNDLPTPQAIAFHPPYCIWLTSPQEQTSQLHCIDIRHLGLDIVF